MLPSEDIIKWLKEGNDGSNSHMIVVCDTFSWEDYPVYVKRGEDVKEVYDIMDVN